MLLGWHCKWCGVQAAAVQVALTPQPPCMLCVHLRPSLALFVLETSPLPSWLAQGVLAANIFDWGAKACVDLYQSATILEMYREVR